MNLLISEEGEVLGQTLSPENAHRQAMIARTSIYAVTTLDELKKLPKQTRKLLWDDYSAHSLADLWNSLKAQKFPYWGKVSVQKVLRSIFDDDTCGYTKDELLDAVPGATWISITTAMSMLKNKDYAKGKPLVIAQSDGMYRRQ